MSSSENPGKRGRSEDDTNTNSRPSKRAKESENNASISLFDTIHDELIVNILVELPIHQLGKRNLVEE
jgi:hypothetical protein